MDLLDNINSPADLRRLPLEQLQPVADEIRQYILETMSRIGGHTGASLGAIELRSTTPLKRLEIALCGMLGIKLTPTRF